MGPTVVTSPALAAAWRDRSAPPVEQVREGVWSVPVPVPDNPIRYTLCYVVRGARGVLVIDPGWDSDEGWHALLEGMQTVAVDPGEVVGILVTHVHPDHHGLSHRLLDRSPGAWVGMGRAEATVLLQLRRTPTELEAAERSWRRDAGIARDDSRFADLAVERGRAFELMPAADLLLDDGDALPVAGLAIRVVTTPGHTPGHICLLDEEAGIVFTGDHLLPRISPNVGLQPDSSGSPLRDYLASLATVGRFDLEALPGHQWRFRGIPHRAAELAAHHVERLDELRAAVAAGAETAAEVAAGATWAHGWDAITAFQRRAAVAETISHLIYLAEDERVETFDSAPIRYRLPRG